MLMALTGLPAVGLLPACSAMLRNPKILHGRLGLETVLALQLIPAPCDFSAGALERRASG